MKKLSSIFATVALLGVSTVAIAQESETDYTSSHNFIGVQGGAQVTLTHYDIMKLATPQYAFQLGRYFNDKVGARLHLMGYQNKTGFQASRYPGINSDKSFKFKACTADLDLLMNMTNVINPNRPSHAFDWVLLCGFGTNYSWDYSDIENFQEGLNANTLMYAPNCGTKHSSFNLRLGTQLNYNVSDAFTIGLELQANDKNDVYNIKTNDKTDWQIAGLLGVTYNFGWKKKQKKEEPAPVVEEEEPIYETRIDTIYYDDVTYNTVPCEESIKKEIHYAVRMSDPISEQMVGEVAEFVKNHKDCKVSVTGYADKGTGNARLNMKYSKQRAQAVTKAIKEAGVPEEIITTEWKGDTVQPFPDNDDNRVAIVTASGTGEKQEKVVTKKSRVEKKRVRVN